MAGVTFGDFFAAIAGIAGPAGGYMGMGLLIYLVCFGGQLVTRRESDNLIEAEQRVNTLNVANHTEIIRLKDERIAIAEGEAELWKQRAFEAKGMEYPGHRLPKEDWDDRRRR